MARYTPTQETFTFRLSYLVNERGIDRVAADYGRSRQTVRRWLGGTQRPAARVQRSVVRRGLRLTGPVERFRDERGRLRSRQVDPRARAAIRTIEAERGARRTAALETATNERQRRMFESDPVALTENERNDLNRRFSELAREDALGRDTRQKWADLREDYRKLAGRS